MMTAMQSAMNGWADEMPEHKRPGAPAKEADMASAGGTPPETFKDYDTEARRELAAKGWALPDGSYPIADKADLQNAIHAIGRGKTPHGTIRKHIVKRAKALGATDMLPEDWKEDMMSDKTEEVKETPAPVKAAPAPESFTVTAEQFAAIQAKADKADALEAQIGTLKTQADTFAAQLAETKRQRRLDQLLQHADNFTAIPAKPAELADALLKLEEKDAELFKYFDGLLTALDKALTQADLFGQRSRDHVETVDTFEAAIEQALTEKFGGDRGKYGEAMALVQAQRPDLAHSYMTRTRAK